MVFVLLTANTVKIYSYFVNLIFTESAIETATKNYANQIRELTFRYSADGYRFSGLPDSKSIEAFRKNRRAMAESTFTEGIWYKIRA